MTPFLRERRERARQLVDARARRPQRQRLVGDDGRRDAEAARPLLDLFAADQLEQLHRRHVLRPDERVLQRHLVFDGVVEVGGRPHLARDRIDLGARHVVEQRREAVASVERERVVHRLVDRARLAARLRHAVELRAVVVLAADHGDDVAGVVVVAEDRPLHTRRLLQQQLDRLGRAGLARRRSWRPRQSTFAGRVLVVGLEPLHLALGVVRPVREPPPARLVRVLHPDDVARAQHAHRRFELLAVARVAGAERHRPHHRRRRQRVDPLAHAHARGARGRRRFDDAQVKPPLGGRLTAVAFADAPPELVGGGAGEARDRPAPALPLVELAQREVDVLLGSGVDPRNHGGLDGQAALEQLLVAVTSRDVAPDVFGEIRRRHAEEVGALAHHDGARAPAVGLVVGQVAGGDHRRQHLIAARARRLQVGQRREPRRGARQPGDHRHLAEVEIADGLVEVAAGGSGDAEGAVAEEDLVEIQGQDVALRKPRLHPARHDRLADLSLDRPLGRQERLRHLLGDRRASLGDDAGAQVGAERAHDAAVVQPLVVVEPAILRRQERLHQLGREAVEGQDLAAFARQLGQRRSVGGAHHRRRRGDVVIRGDVGQQGQRRREVDVGSQRRHQQRAQPAQQAERIEAQQPVEEAAVGAVDHLDPLAVGGGRWRAPGRSQGRRRRDRVVRHVRQRRIVGIGVGLGLRLQGRLWRRRSRWLMRDALPPPSIRWQRRRLRRHEP